MFVCPTFLFVALDFSEPNHPCLATFCNCILSGYKDIIYVLKNIISVSLISTKHLLWKSAKMYSTFAWDRFKIIVKLWPITIYKAGKLNKTENVHRCVVIWFNICKMNINYIYRARERKRAFD